MGSYPQMGIRVRNPRPRADDAMTLANRVPPCGTCGGVPHVSGLPCVCDGANTVYAEVQGLRQQLIGAQAEVGKLRRETVAQAAGWEREMDKWRAGGRGLGGAVEEGGERGRPPDHPRGEDAMSDDTPITDDERARVEARHAGDGAVSDPLAEMIQARLGAEWRCAPALAAAVRAYARARGPGGGGVGRR